jgi:flagella basal body P-ring formation protein FlgA
MPEDIIVNSRTIPGGVSDPHEIIGMEARVALYAGRPIRAGDVGFPAVVERNQIIALHYNLHGLLISTEGRALGRAGPGDTIRVMNISSRSTVTAQVGADGAAYVSR